MKTEIKAYVYNDQLLVVAIIVGNNEKAIESKFNECFDEEVSLTYSPGFGACDGLRMGGDLDVYDVRG